ncbi:MAG: hypothetical protein FJ087_02205, partial [Deltaproteobacteria bacterium]|nr:hypothetical protein [Deltaproteobacteria bacterium]
MKPGHLAAPIAVAVACACSGGGNGGGEPDFAPPDDVVDGDAVTDVPPADAPKQPVLVGEDFRVIYGYAGRPVKPELVGRHDLLLADPRDADPENDFSLTDRALKKLDPPLNCDIGCFTDPDMRWLAVATATEAKDGTRTIKLGRFLADHQAVNMDKFEGLTGVKHLAFAGDFLFFTRPQPDCQADEGPPATCFQVFRLDLNTLARMDLILTFPPPDTLAHSMYGGYFTPSEDGSTVVFMNPRNNSQRVYVWRAGPPGALRKVGDTLCAVPDPQGMPGQCGPGGTLSTYTEG